jgi:hypothetical protein
MEKETEGIDHYQHHHHEEEMEKGFFHKNTTMNAPCFICFMIK